MKRTQRGTVTLAVVWIALMGILTTPEWVRAARDFVTRRASGTTESAPAVEGGGGGAEIQA